MGFISSAPLPPGRMARIVTVVGTRPEIIKMASVIHELRARHADHVVLHTGQHYDANLSEVFFEELALPKPDRNLEVGSGTQAEQTATALVRLEAAFRELSPDVVLVEGDTNTVLAAALAAAKLGIRVGHVEAGLRSYDLRMPEEHNRRLTDHLSAFLFAPTEGAAETLRKEACWGAVHVTGNTVIDACLRYGPKAQAQSAILRQVPFDTFALATFHRAENVDDPRVLRELVEVLVRCPVPVVYPIHPRTRGRFEAAGLEGRLRDSGNVQLLPPVGYLDFLALLMRCAFVLTDSGGIQEEVTAPNIRKKAFVLRRSTERPEAVRAGYAEVLGTDAEVVLRRLKEFASSGWKSRRASPFGDGRAGLRIVDLLQSEGRKKTGARAASRC